MFVKFCIWLYLILLLNIFMVNLASTPDSNCFYYGLSPLVSSILCDIQNGAWYIQLNSSAMKHVGCLIGSRKRCQSPMRVPKINEVSPSPPPPKAKNKQYQLLATAAEMVIPRTWWRKSFADDMLLLTHNDSDLPRKQLDISRLSVKKLRNIVQCVTRQQFIRTSFSFKTVPSSSKCDAMNESIIKQFYDLWTKETEYLAQNIGTLNAADWSKSQSDHHNLTISSLQVLDYFYTKHGSVWTGCFQLDDASTCRGALAAAAWTESIHILYSVAHQHIDFIETNFVSGYLLASLGRGLLHGDMDTIGHSATTIWKVRNADFIALQSAYLNLYINSFGKLYNEQLNAYIPMAFAPEFKMLKSINLEWRQYANFIEPIYTSLRNWMFTEASNLIDFGPYRPLVSFPEVRSKLRKQMCRRVLIDVGANGFFASPKYLLDSYSIFLPFTDAIMIEPEPHFSAEVPISYKKQYNITHLQIYAEVATGSNTDMIKLLPALVKKEDFVVLKFDVDPNRYAQGPTMEWGFLFSLMQNPDIVELIDELYIELHFHFPALNWKHYHSNWEALDTLRYLRSLGVVVHSWP